MSERIGIVDWGIGGTGIYDLIKRKRDVPVVYLSDTGAMPYGKMSRGELVRRLNAVLRFFRNEGVSKIVIGCNAASTAIRFLDADTSSIIGMIEPAVELAVKQKPARLGLVGGRRTVLSNVYRKAFVDRGIAVQQRIAQPLSGMIESGDLGSPAFKSECRHILRPLAHSSHILLACTHYAAAQKTMADAVSPETVFIDPANAIVDKVLEWKTGTGGGDVFYTTGNADDMRSAAKNAFGVTIAKARSVSI